jgi:hypothetical protein
MLTRLNGPRSRPNATVRIEVLSDIIIIIMCSFIYFNFRLVFTLWQLVVLQWANTQRITENNAPRSNKTQHIELHKQ